MSMPDIRLSVLICHIPERHRLLDRLLALLEPQKQHLIEVIVDDGGGSIGVKRNRLLDKANGQYVAFVDDDDLVSDDYAESVCSMIAMSNPDCVGIVGLVIQPGKDTWTFRHSISVDRWCKDKERHIYFRCPNHLNPIKASIAKSIRFPDISHGEDRDWSERIRPYLKTEEFIEHPIYFYYP